MTMESVPRRNRPRASVAAVAVVSHLLAPLVSTATRSAAAVAGTPIGLLAADRSSAETAAHDHDVRVVGLINGYRPQGVASCGGTLFVSSAVDGQITAVDLRSGHRRTLLPGAPGRSLRGLHIDSRSDLLFAAGNEAATGIVLAVDRRSGHLVQRWRVPGAGRLSDVAVTPDAAWITDALVDRLTRIRLNPAPGSTLGHSRRLTACEPHHVALRGSWPTAAGHRAHGIRALPDGTLLLDHSSAGGLWAVCPADGTVRSVPVTGGPAITGGDGLERDGDQIWIVRGVSRNGVAQVRLDNHHGRLTARWVRELTDAALDTPCAAARAGRRLWTVNARFGASGPDTDGYWLTGLPVTGRARQL
jgi:streptogramin lyase